MNYRDKIKLACTFFRLQANRNWHAHGDSDFNLKTIE
nr:MAG TPA: hypothetical protein [Caudoviricetes sp.]